MIINVMSDLHLEFGDFHPGEGDVLVLAGDVCVAYDLATDPEYEERYIRFFNECVKNYNKVFYVLGNHEHYNSNLRETAKIIRRRLPYGISLLDDQVEKYGHLNFVGATLWTDFDSGSNITMMTAQQSMSDYHCIGGRTGLLKASEVLNEHTQTIKWMDRVLPELEGDVFMITHHAPCLDSFGEDYREASARGAYATDLTKFIEKHSNIKHWVHGHIHETNDYMVHQCRVMSNPRGYDGYELNPNFNPKARVILQDRPIRNRYVPDLDVPN